GKFRGQMVRVWQDRGRNKTINFVGVLSQIYQNVFVVNIATTNEQCSMSYTDILCGKIIINADLI
ncbi:MAG: Veg family protein, partial [Clostridia bacterium]